MWVVVVVVRVAGGGGGASAVTVVCRVVVVVDSGVLEQETSVKPTTDIAEPSMIAFFIVNLFCLQTDSSQVASADVLGRIILLTCES